MTGGPAVPDPAGPPNYFDRRIARSYEVKWPEVHDPAVVAQMVDLLAGLARGGRVLEFAVGTGRVARPLAERGLEVHGIELSPDMVAVLREQPGAERVGVTLGDMATVRVPGSFSLVFVVANSLSNLTSQEAQVQAFTNAAGHLEPGGRFLVELWIPELQRLAVGQTVSPFTVTPEHLGFDELDVATQAVTSHHYWFSDGGVETFSAPFRYAWPAELDLMARLAGLELEARWGGFGREPFTATSGRHVSVWRKPF